MGAYGPRMANKIYAVKMIKCSFDGNTYSSNISVLIFISISNEEKVFEGLDCFRSDCGIRNGDAEEVQNELGRPNPNNILPQLPGADEVPMLDEG